MVEHPSSMLKKIVCVYMCVFMCLKSSVSTQSYIPELGGGRRVRSLGCLEHAVNLRPTCVTFYSISKRGNKQKIKVAATTTKKHVYVVWLQVGIQNSGI